MSIISQHHVPAMKPYLCVLVCLMVISAARGAFPTLHLKPVVLQQIHAPTCIVAAPDGTGRLFVCDQPGKVLIIEDGMLRPTPFLDLTTGGLNTKVLFHNVSGQTPVSYSERGLLSLAFHPGYAVHASSGHGKFYLSYTKAYQAGIDPPPHDGGTWTPNCTTVIAEFQVSSADPNRADPLSERRLLLYPQPQSNHNGGNIVFDTNGLLYVGSGDGGSADDNNIGHTGGANTTPRPSGALGNGQDKTNLLGKILRIDPLDPDGTGPLTYSIPPGNPFFTDSTPGIRKEIYAYGIRNPWGLSFDDGPGGTGRFFCADVGQGRIEEVNLIVNGGNYGWRYMEGTERPSFSSTMAHPGGTLIDPVAQYGHPGISGTSLPLLGLSITGGCVYRGSAMPALQGKYIFGDYGSTSGAPSGRLMGLEETSPGIFALTEALPVLGGNPLSTRIMCLGRDSAGELYVGTKSSGGVMAMENGLPNGGLYKLVPAPVNPAPVVLTAVKDNSMFSETGGAGEELSNGTGPLFMGTTSDDSDPNIRRALLQFDLSNVPAGSRFTSAWLQIFIDAADTPTGTPARNTFLNRVNAGWGEASSFSAAGGAFAMENDATWQSRLYHATTPQLWVLEGGDYSNTLSSSHGIDSITGIRSFFGPQMVHDVHEWMTAPTANFGWLLRSDEGVPSTVKTVSSRENSNPAKRPQLVLVHARPFEKWLAGYFPSHLTGQWVEPDPDGDGIVTQLEYALGFSPLVYNAQNGITATFSPPFGGSRTLITNFRRDSAATDLTYRLEISPDLINWTPIAQSVGGAPTTGQNGGTITGETAAEATILQVGVSRTLTGSDAVKQFVRVAIERAP